MLQATASTSIEVRTLRKNPQTARVENPSSVREVVFGVLLPDLQLHGLARKGAVDENHFAVDTCDPAPFVIEGINASHAATQRAAALAVAFASVARVQAERNSFQCGAFDRARVPRTRSNSFSYCSIVSRPRIN